VSSLLATRLSEQIDWDVGWRPMEGSHGWHGQLVGRARMARPVEKMSGERFTRLSFEPRQPVAWASPGVRSVHRAASSKGGELSLMRMPGTPAKSMRR